ncbi:MAG: NADH:flavin oxidoreductase [Deltaproteobacteria bacterium]|jgi:2,4-dienoyl-CoA reductase-like NADH-dependent reductase (Old Yellow Enzyme family)|nr:NADH:flavin oxidoreductase [Deltaproteobacteria bacterium]
MIGKFRKTTRREFLKTSGKIAGTVVFSGFTTGCMSTALEPEKIDSTNHALSEGREAYTVFSPGQIGSMTVKNRLVRSATMIAAAGEGQPTEEYIERYSELARGGAGVIITGFMIPTRTDARYERQIFVYDDKYISGLQRLVEAIHETGSDCRLVAQIGHSGQTVSPSGIKWPFPWKRRGRVLTGDEVDAIVGDFADAIWRVKTAGFDGVELHGAHAYLLSSFLSPLTNQRTDRYGGSLQKRVHIIQAIMDRSRERVGPDFPIFIKVNSDDNAARGIQPENFSALANEIVKTGVAAIDVSGNDCLQVDIEDPEDQAYFFPGAKTLEVKAPIILTGGNRSLAHMEELLNTSEIDFLGMARPFIREPDLPNRWLAGSGDESSACISCNGCFSAIMQGKTAYCTQLS